MLYHRPVPLLSDDPSRRYTERLMLGHALVWVSAVAAVALSGALATWRDGAHLAFGVAMAAIPWLVPLVAPAPADRERPLGDRHVIRYNLLVFLFSFLQCYFGSPLFFDSLGMEYHFHVTWVVNRTPLFLYFLTVAYFSLYYVLLGIAWRAFRGRFPGAPPVARLGVRALISYGCAFGETFVMANDRLREWFFYRDKHFALLWGSICYGTVFFVSLPLFERLDERPPLRRVAWDALAANMLLLVCYAAYGALIAWAR
jgi:hypothetical protein